MYNIYNPENKEKYTVSDKQKFYTLYVNIALFISMCSTFMYPILFGIFLVLYLLWNYYVDKMIPMPENCSYYDSLFTLSTLKFSDKVSEIWFCIEFLLNIIVLIFMIVVIVAIIDATSFMIILPLLFFGIIYFIKKIRRLSHENV